MDNSLFARLYAYRGIVVFPFQLWLWAVSIPIRFFLYMTVGEFWKYSEAAKVKGASANGTTFFSAPVSTSLPASMTSKKSDIRGALLSADQSVLSDPGRNVLKGAWTNDFLSAPASTLAQGTLTKSDANIMLEKPEIRKIEVNFSNIKETSSKKEKKVPASAPAKAPMSRLRNIDNENRIASFITVDKDMHDSFTKHEEQTFSFIAVEKPEQQVDAFTKIEETPLPLPAFFVALDEVPAEAPEKSSRKSRKSSKKSPKKPVEKKTEEKPASLVAKSDDSELRAQLDKIAAEKAELQAELEKINKTKKNETALLEMNMRKNFDLQQQLTLAQKHLQERELDTKKAHAELDSLQKNFEELSNKQKESAKAEKETKMVAEPKEEAHAAWAHNQVKSYTELIVEAQHQPKTFAETIKESLVVPKEKSEIEEFAVVGGPESSKHVTSIVAN